MLCSKHSATCGFRRNSPACPDAFRRGGGRRQLVICNVKLSPSNARNNAPAERSSPTAEATFQKAVEVMLNRAASSLERGPSTCLGCRGQGSVECAHCKGAGRLDPRAAAAAGGVHSALLRLRSAVGLAPAEVPYAGSQWMITNRCPRCHGTGKLVCELCSGSGKRYPHGARKPQDTEQNRQQ